MSFFILITLNKDIKIDINKGYINVNIQEINESTIKNNWEFINIEQNITT